MGISRRKKIFALLYFAKKFRRVQSMNVWNKLVALQVALNLLVLVSCSKDGSSTEGMQCFK